MNLKELLKRLKDKLSVTNNPADIPPPDMKIPTRSIAKDISSPKVSPLRVKSTHDRLTPHKTTYRDSPDAVDVDSAEPTQELLKLTDDVIDAMDAEGFDPYNTKEHTSTGGWDKHGTKR